MVLRLSMSAVLWKELAARGVTVTHSEKQILCKLLLWPGEGLTYPVITLRTIHDA